MRLARLPIFPAGAQQQAARRASAVVTFTLSGFVEGQWNRVGVTPAKKQHVLRDSLHGQAHQGKKRLHGLVQPPIPLPGGFRRPSNITRDYAQFYLCTALVPRLRKAKTVRFAA